MTIRISGKTAQQMVADGAQLVDVRTSPEAALGTLPGAINLPLQQLPGGCEQLDNNRPVIVYCAAGSRSARAAILLEAAGFQVYDLGAKRAWAGPTTGLPTLPLLAALTIGLAPFTPEPHLVGKLRWVAGGAVGMSPTDWFDLVLHGAPWLWLAFALRTTRSTKPTTD